jgi:anti-sigma regulatory factor (Ser/Thr protein kinase)
VWFSVPELADPGREAPTTVVRLEIPVQPTVVRAARLVASGLATTAGFDVNNVDDIRIAVDELCAVLFELGDGGVVELVFAISPGGIEVSGRTHARQGEIDVTPISLALQILEAASDEFSWSVQEGVAELRLAKGLPLGERRGPATVHPLSRP